MTRTHKRRIVPWLLTASVGLVFVGENAGRAARDEGIPVTSLTRSPEPAGNTWLPAAIGLPRQVTVEAVFSLGEDEDQPAGACWLASAGSCLCSAASIENVLTPDFMRVLLASWRDTKRLTTGEWQQRMREVDAACGSPSPVP